ncbi:histidine phosphatase family protein [Acetobacter peroxydans]|jgi:probable phosphoglycerate mutase|uniref:histidine phosphatase family protein n=1 Tax=Acetobacter peroxydans TaxID=104098 RepID=UPI002352D8AD|nr:histidine phosphatase family protein [Acetobacter peroxydans]MCH4093358.1 histidine phosphatase family protein [Acetobacter peroxydans]MCH4142636.1 histidine phosphatase family protein [Acetobacter peroxydans]MCI1394594.1 histidine phosphatase family protein [Acetobacter peroxydans]MCI1410372.1 histidine phosphatase family protein [Acetobacter peroxydans]MCI1440803.1 histidine phosphatase family protein [Acetobacter peroxydans]
MTQLLPRPYWYLRHGQTDWNRAGLSQGRTDVPLNETGIEQAAEAAALIAQALDAAGEGGIVRIVSSPLERALRTATIVRDALVARGLPALPLSIEPDLAEVSFGEQEGQPISDWYDHWIAGDYTPPQAESFAVLRARAVGAINRATASAGRPLVVAHGALFRALRAAMDLPANVRLANAVPLSAAPRQTGGWALEELS